MKKISKRLLTMLLAVAMVFGLSGMTAFAAEADGQDAQALAAQSGTAAVNTYTYPDMDTMADITPKEYVPDFSWYTPGQDSYTIISAAQLAAFSDIVNGAEDLPSGINQNSFYGQTVYLGNNIQMNADGDVSSEDGIEGDIATPTLYISDDAYAFTPIGNMHFKADGSRDYGYSFQGTFDGNGHEIENLFVYSGLDEDGYDGLFGTVGMVNYTDRAEEGMDTDGAIGVVRNFTVTGLVWVRGGEYGTEIDFAGGVCARLTAGGVIEDVTNKARIYTPFTDNVGGIVGFAGTPHAMGGSSETGGGTDTSNPGYDENPSAYNTFVLRCANKATVNAFHKNGGIVGENAATVKYCHNSGWINCRRNYSGIRMGGIAGTNGNNGAPCEESVIAYCYNTGEISNGGSDDLRQATGDKTVRGYGGITGSNYGGHGGNEIYNCYNIGAIPKGYGNYNSIASYLDEAKTGYGTGAFVSIRNNYTLKDASDIVINSASTQPQETGLFMTEDEFKSDQYGYYYDESGELKTYCLTNLGPYFVYDEYGDNDKYAGFPILWWEAENPITLPTLTGLTIVQEPYTTTYRDGDTFSPEGMVVLAEYDNGTTALLYPDGDFDIGNWYTRTGGYHYQYEYGTGEWLDGTKQFVEISYSDGENEVKTWQPVNNATPIVEDVTITSDDLDEDGTKIYDGTPVTLTAEATLDPEGAETYQWYKDDKEIEGATEKELTLDGVVSDSGTYKCVVTISLDEGEPVSDSGELKVTITEGKPSVSSVEISSNIDGNTKPYDGEDVILTADAVIAPTGAVASYQWSKKNESGEFVDIGGATDRALTLANGTVSDSGTYRCEVTASLNGEMSDPVFATIEITIEKAGQKLSFAQSEMTVTLGDEETITNPLSGVEENATIEYSSSEPTVASVDENGKVTIHAAGTVTITATALATDNYKETSVSYELTINPAPVPVITDVTITSDMEGTDNTKTYDGEEVTLTVAVNGENLDSADLTYRWYKDDVEIGQNTDNYTLDGNVVDSGTYRCEVTATLKDETSDPMFGTIKITINPADQDVSFEDPRPEITYMLDDGSFVNALTGVAGNANVVYASSIESVATVDEYGAVSIKSTGETVITATVSGDDNYKDTTASYTLVIIEEMTMGDVTITSDMEGSDNTKTYDGKGVTLTAHVEVKPDSAQKTYQWYDSDGEIARGTGDTLELDGNVSDSGAYYCVVTATHDQDSAVKYGDITITIEKAAQKIVFASDSVEEAVGETFTNETTEESVLFETPAYESSDTSVATVDPATGEVTIVGVGEAEITATVEGTDNYSEDSASYTVTGVDEGLSVTVTSDLAGNEKTYNGEPVKLTATAASSVKDATFTYQWYADGDAMEGATGETLTLGGDVSDSGTYTCEVTVSYPNGATDKIIRGELAITINRAEQEISFEVSTVEKTVDDPPFTNALNGVAEDASVTFASSNESVATVDPATGEVTIVGAGEATISATTSETDNYAATTASYELTVKAVQQEPTVGDVTITSTMDGSTKTYDGTGVSLTASAEDVEPADAEVTYQWYKDDEPIEGMTGNVLNLAGDVADSGTYKCVVTVTSEGESVDGEGEITITIEPAAQDVSFAETEITKTVGDAPFTNELSGTADGAAVTYKSSNPDVAAVDETTGEVTILAAGEVMITADVSATANYAGTAVSYTLTIEDAQAPAAVDKTGLEAAIDAAEGLAASDYTEDSWNAMLAALDTAEVVDADGDVTQDEVDDARIALVAAIAKLQPADGQTAVPDKNDLLDEFEEGMELTGSDYTPESWENFNDALSAAQDVLTDPGATEEDIEDALQALEDAKAALDAVPADEVALDEAIDDASALVESDYTPDSWAALQEALAAAEAVKADPDALQSEVDAALNDLETAMNDLEALPVDKTVLEAAISDADALNKSDYTEDSWEALQIALEAGKAVYADPDATQSQVKTAEIALIEAIATLESAGGQSGTVTDKSSLMNEYIADLDYSANDYTEDSWAPFADALAEALDVLTNPDATQDDVEKAEEALVTAKQNLLKKGDSGDGGTVKNGLYMIDKGVRWGYYVNDKVDTSFTGFVSNENGDWYVQNGYVIFADPSEQGVFKDTTGAIGTKGTWYYVTGGKVQHDFTGLAHYKNQYGWWYITGGVVDFTHNGVDKNQNGWWYVKNGKVEFGHNGVDKNQYGWWYITGGKVRFDFTGLGNYRNQYGWWYITGGKVDFSHSGVDKNKNGWWYVSGGKVDFTFNGIASNRYGTWYLRGGKVDFGYNGTVTAGGTTYTVRGGKVR